MKFCTVNAFTPILFKGTPVAVCVMDRFRDDDFLQSVATEVNLSDTSFVVPLDDNHFSIRWFTPTHEILLSGHGALAAAHVLWTEMEIVKREEIYFESKSGILKTWREDHAITMDLPAFYASPTITPDGLFDALGVSAVCVSECQGDCVIELHDEKEVTDLQPDFTRMPDMQGFNSMIITSEASPESDYDYVCRVFCSKQGMMEEPVSSIAQCRLGAYWSERLGKKKFKVHQASKRGGSLIVLHEGDRIYLTGEAITAFSGKFVGV